MCIYDTKHMDAASSAKESFQAMNASSSMHNSVQKQNEHDSKIMHDKSMENVLARPESADAGQPRPSPESTTNIESNLGRDDMQQSGSKNSIRSMRKGKKVPSILGSRKYILRSSLGGVRVLRSKSNGDCQSEITPNTNNNSAHLTTESQKKRKKRKRRNRGTIDELLGTRKRVRYLFSRMNYEQNLIDAYSGEGWKGQSLEKIRPEKELQRAASEILRCKLKVREIFQHLDNLCSEGRFQESLFDSEGQIHSEDIFCAKCGSKEFSANNDIILCDGICDRGFHQKCLVPPLLNEEIPPGDESWLCPECDCKADCIELLNEIQETNLSIEDKWEKVFPEAAASAAEDRRHDEYLGLPSDDSEDDDYDPDRPDLNTKVSEEGSGSEESNTCSTSDGSSASASDEQHERTGFSSDDSEDDDYDPDAPDIDEKLQREGSSSDESDFTSDSSGMSASSNDNDSSRSDEVPAGMSQDHSGPVNGLGRPKVTTENRKPLNSELLSILEPDPSGEIASSISGKRHCIRLDYKKLHDETYGNIPSDSSDDEDWTEMSTPKKEKEDSVVLSKRNTSTAQNGQVSTRAQSTPVVEVLPKPMIDVVGVTENTSNRKPCAKMDAKIIDHSVTSGQKDNFPPDSSGNKATIKLGATSFGVAISQRLCESLKENEYPTRVTRENLSRELGITVQQISRWFVNARRNLRLSANREGTEAEKSTRDNQNILNSWKDPQSGSKVVTNSAGSRSEEMRNKAVVKPNVMEHRVGDEERKKRVASRSYWNSAKYESRKRRMDKVIGFPNDASRVSGTPRKGEETKSPRVERSQETGQNANSHVSRSEVEEVNTIQSRFQHSPLKGQSAYLHVSSAEVPLSKTLIEGHADSLSGEPTKGKETNQDGVQQFQKRGQNPNLVHSNIQTRSRSRRAIT